MQTHPKTHGLTCLEKSRMYSLPLSVPAARRGNIGSLLKATASTNGVESSPPGGHSKVHTIYNIPPLLSNNMRVKLQLIHLEKVYTDFTTNFKFYSAVKLPKGKYNRNIQHILYLRHDKQESTQTKDLKIDIWSDKDRNKLSLLSEGEYYTKI